METLSGTYQVSTDGGLTYSAPADVDQGATALETAIEQAIGRMADPTDSTDATVTDAGNLLRGCGFAYDVEFPAGPRLPAPTDQFILSTRRRRTWKRNTTQEGSQYEVWNVVLDSTALRQVLPVVRRLCETDDLAVGISATELSDKILAGLKLATTDIEDWQRLPRHVHGRFAEWRPRPPAAAGRPLLQIHVGKGDADLIRSELHEGPTDGRWNPLSGTLDIAMNDNWINM